MKCLDNGRRSESDRKSDLARALYWELVMVRKLRDSALRDRRIDDINLYSKQLLAVERRARAFLDSDFNTTGE